MQYDRWRPWYDEIRAEFVFPFAAEQHSAALLRRLLPRGALEDPLGRIARRLGGHEVVVAGMAPETGAPPLWRRRTGPAPVALVAADGAAEICLSAGLVPDVIVTDLDGPVPSEVLANARGALVVIHAHGDNSEALGRWVPEFAGELAGSWAGPPADGLIDAGGFTDGDRAAFLAEEVGAVRILLWGFDFTRVDEDDPRARARKMRKLRWAQRLLAELSRSSSVPIEEWSRDGAIRPYVGPATQ